MVRRKYWGRFWCSWTNRKWPTLIPDCDNSAANCVTLWVGFWAWPHAIPKKTSNCRYVTRRPWWYPRIIWGASLDGASYVLSIPLQISEKPMRSFTSVQMIHTHTSHIARFDFGRASLAGSAIHQLKWTCRMLVYKAALTLFRGEIRRLLEYLDRVVEAHAVNHLPRLVEFPRCRSSRQSVW